MPPSNQTNAGNQMPPVDNNNSKLNTVLLVVLILLAIFCAWKLMDKDTKPDVDAIPFVPSPQGQNNQNTQNNQPIETGMKKIIREKYSFEVPTDWIDGSPVNFEGCIWQNISNDSGDGHRMAGEIGIYPKSCFDLSKATGKREYTEKNGYYIIAYYDQGEGAIQAEVLETKQVYQKVVDTFALN